MTDFEKSIKKVVEKLCREHGLDGKSVMGAKFDSLSSLDLMFELQERLDGVLPESEIVPFDPTETVDEFTQRVIDACND